MSADRRLALQPAHLLVENLNTASTRQAAPITADHFLIAFDTFGNISNLTVFGQPTRHVLSLAVTRYPCFSYAPVQLSTCHACGLTEKGE